MKRIKEFFIEKLIFLSGILSIIFVLLILTFLLKEGAIFFQTHSISSFLLGKDWYPISDPPKFGILPLILGSLLVTLGAIAISIPLGISVAIFISEIAPSAIKNILKGIIEFLAAIPSIVLGFLGIAILSPIIKKIFHLPSGLTAFTGSIMLAFMAMPTIVSIIEDAINSVPRSYKEGSMAMGATRWQTIYRVVIPAASSGILAAIMLGIGRVIGETMAVLMISGNAAQIPRSFFQPVRTMTATIAAEMGEVVQGTVHYHSLFAIGIILFIIAFSINLIADIFLRRKGAWK